MGHLVLLGYVYVATRILTGLVAIIYRVLEGKIGLMIKLYICTKGKYVNLQTYYPKD